VVFDLRKAGNRRVRVWVSARTSSGRLLKQRRTYQPCSGEASLRKAVGGL
jgi:hypothetical protein